MSNLQSLNFERAIFPLNITLIFTNNFANQVTFTRLFRNKSVNIYPKLYENIVSQST